MNCLHPLGYVPSLRSLAQFYTAQVLWGTPFKGENIEFAEYREKISDKIFKMLLPASLKPYLRQGVILLEQAYIQAFHWNKIYREFGASPLLMISNGTYFAPRYFTAEGHFDDVAWVKRFIQDSNQWIIHRFCLACCYCFEDEIFFLWQQIKEDSETYIHGYLRSTPVVSLWMYKLENNYDDFFVGPAIIFPILYSGIIEGLKNGYEQAIYYLWQHLHNDAKEAAKEGFYLPQAIVTAAELKCVKIVNFFLSQLSVEQKSRMVRYMKMYKVWWCLLESPITHSSGLQEILNFPCVPDLTYAYILYNLAYSFEKNKLTMFKNAFRLLWQKISEDLQIFILEAKPMILTHLVNTKELDIVGLIIKRLPAEDKEDYLLRYGNDHIRVLSARRDYKLVEQYLLFFLINFDKTSHIEVVGGHAASLFTPRIITACTDGLTETKKREVNKVIDALVNSQATISELLEQAEKLVLPLS